MRKAVSYMVVWSNNELLVGMAEGVREQTLAAHLENADNIETWSAESMERVFPDSRLVEPPQLFMHYPVRLPFSSVQEYAGKFGLSISISAEGGRTGTAVICYKSDGSCYLAAGVRSCLAGYGDLLFTSGDPARDLELNGKVDSQEISSVESRVEAAKKRRLTGLDAGALNALPQ